MMKAQSLAQRLIVSLITGLVCGAVFSRAAHRFLPFFPHADGYGPAAYVGGILILIGFMVSAFFWRDRSLVFVVGALRYAIAFDLAMFGFQKFFGMQFFVPMGMLDEPFNNISSKWLMWAYFGRSLGFVYTIAITQIIGSLLLLFNRTRLLGVTVLIPVMVNIILLDYFYQLELGVLAHALILFSGLIYLLLLDYERLVAVFLDSSAQAFSMPWRNNILKYAGRLSIIVIPLLLLMSAGPRDKNKELTGRYAVTELDCVKLTPANTCDSVLTRVYFDYGNDCVFEFNGLDRRMFGTYDLNKQEGRVKITWRHPPAARQREFDGVLKLNGGGEIELVGLMGGDSIRAKLVKNN